MSYTHTHTHLEFVHIVHFVLFTLTCFHRAIEGSNVGHRMLVKMGWSEGSGLGRGEQGQVNPVSAFIHE